MRKFEVGKRYTHGWIGDSDLFTTWTVIKRTAKTVTIKEENTQLNNTKTCRIIDRLSQREGAECVFPFGQYSMAPTLRANKEG